MDLTGIKYSVLVAVTFFSAVYPYGNSFEVYDQEASFDDVDEGMKDSNSHSNIRL